MDPIGGLVGWVAVYGTFGLFAIGLAERFVPMLPSHALLLAVGVTAADDYRLLPAAVFATTLGSTLGCMASFFAVRALGETRTSRLVAGTGRLFGMSTGQVEHRIASLRRNGTALAFSLQLVPTARIVAPPLAALLQGGSGRFLFASAAGITVWNGMFIGVGYAASQAVGDMNATVLALAILALLVAAQASLFWIGRRMRVRRSLMTMPAETC
ncbi:MAG: VTT domain-containing protein [Aurantimonas endophytica]|uniref:DedA family protein n=1 Tax=Aurantimonas endophytica TaxID=1522175 RepID=UPI00300301C0